MMVTRAVAVASRLLLEIKVAVMAGSVRCRRVDVWCGF